MRNYNCYINRFRMLVLIAFLFTLNGCGSMKSMVRDTHSTLMEIMMLTELEEVDNTAALENTEQQIRKSCEPLLSSVYLKMEGKEIPLFKMLDILLSYPDCRDTVENARFTLLSYNTGKPDKTLIH